MNTNSMTPQDLLTIALEGWWCPPSCGCGRSGHRPSEQVEAIVALRRRLEEAEHDLAFSLRLHGSTWQQVADAMGMNSRQAAQHRYEKSAGLLDRLDAARGRAPKD